MSANSRKEQILSMLKDEPTDSFLLYGLAMEHQSAGEEEQALKVFGDLMETNPDYPPGYLQAGQLLARMGKEAQAKSVYEKGIQTAKKVGDGHAAGEMESFLSLLD